MKVSSGGGGGKGCLGYPWTLSCDPSKAPNKKEKGYQAQKGMLSIINYPGLKMFLYSSRFSNYSVSHWLPSNSSRFN